jgi:predicted RNase H-like nuclease (RuvC/YqgF family)
MRPLLSVVATIILLAPLAACSSSEDMALLHREITDVQRSVERLQTEVLDQSDLQGMEQSMQDMTNKNLRSNADLALRVEELQEQIEALHASLEVTTRRLQNISQELAAARAQSGAGVVLPPVTVAPGSEGAGSESGGMPAGAVAAGAARIT